MTRKAKTFEPPVPVRRRDPGNPAYVIVYFREGEKLWLNLDKYFFVFEAGLRDGVLVHGALKTRGGSPRFEFFDCQNGRTLRRLKRTPLREREATDLVTVGLRFLGLSGPTEP